MLKIAVCDDSPLFLELAIKLAQSQILWDFRFLS